MPDSCLKDIAELVNRTQMLLHKTTSYLIVRPVRAPRSSRRTSHYQWWKSTTLPGHITSDEGPEKQQPDVCIGALLTSRRRTLNGLAPFSCDFLLPCVPLAADASKPQTFHISRTQLSPSSQRYLIDPFTLALAYCTTVHHSTKVIQHELNNIDNFRGCVISSDASATEHHQKCGVNAGTSTHNQPSPATPAVRTQDSGFLLLGDLCPIRSPRQQHPPRVKRRVKDAPCGEVGGSIPLAIVLVVGLHNEGHRRRAAGE